MCKPEHEEVLKTIDMGMIFDIKRYAIHDGPGIRTTVFLKGCPLNCLWCHNPEGIRPERELMWRAERCIGCGSCEEACPKEAVSFPGGAIRIDSSTCDLCGRCVEACMPAALVLAGEDISVDRLVAEIVKDRVFYEESGGGVTLSGGEPSSQPAFAGSVFESCRSMSIHTTLDTCGHADPEILSDVCRHADLILYDLKLIDPEKHIRYTGMSNELILNNLKKLARDGARVHIRYPLVPGVNDGDEDIGKLGDRVSSLDSIDEVHLLRYHRAGEGKMKRFVEKRTSCGVKGTLTEEKVEAVERRLKSFGLTVRTGA